MTENVHGVKNINFLDEMTAIELSEFLRMYFNYLGQTMDEIFEGYTTARLQRLGLLSDDGDNLSETGLALGDQLSKCFFDLFNKSRMI